MEFMNWPTAVAVVGSVGSLVLGILKILAMRKSSEPDSKTMVMYEEKCAKLQSSVDVHASEIRHLEETTKRQDEDLSKLQDLLIKLLTDK